MINVIHDRIPSADCNSPDPLRRHHSLEFNPLTASFVERGGFATITNKKIHPEMKLPRWVPHPYWYRANEDGSVWGRHFTQDRFRRVANSAEEWKKKYLKNEEEYLTRSGYTLKDVFD